MTEPSAQRNTYRSDSNYGAMDRATRYCSYFLNIMLAVSLACLAEKVGTVSIEEILSILHDKEVHRKIFCEHLHDIYPFLAYLAFQISGIFE